MRQAYMEKTVSSVLNSPDLLPAQRKVLKRFDLEAEKNEGLSLATRKARLVIIHHLGRTIKKPFLEMKKEDIETFIFGLNLSPSSIDLHKIIIRKFFKWLYKTEEYPDAVKWLKLKNHKKRKLPEDILTPVEIKALVDAADNPRDRALVSVLFESGCRLGEIIGLKQKDVKIDQYGAVIMVSGKTGQRRIRLIDSAPDIMLWLNNHPNKGEGKPLFVNLRNPDKPLEDMGIQHLLVRLAKTAGLEKHVHPHLLRHSRMTQLAKDFTESELKILAGWSGDSRMPGVYVHLSGADIERKQLKKAGLIDEEDSRKEDEVLKPRICPRCKETNPATAKFCYRCGMALDLATAQKIESKDTGLVMEFMELMSREPRLLDILKGVASATPSQGEKEKTKRVI